MNSSMNNSVNYMKACQCLELDENGDWEIEDLKRQYRRMALMYHPDKNKHPDAADRFRHVQESYEYLGKEYDKFEDIDLDLDADINLNTEFCSFLSPAYRSILYSFLASIMNTELFNEIKTRVFYTVLECIVDKCEEKALSILRKMDKRKRHKIRELLSIYGDVFHISPDFLDKMDQIFVEESHRDECIILNPFLDDLMDNHLYRLTENGNTYFIPLWHHELVYDNSGADLYVQLVPILPDGYEIDANNHVHIRRSFTIDEIWQMSDIEICVGKRRFMIPRNQLKLMEEQKYVIAGSGITQINSKDIYDISKKGDIYVHISILQ